MLRGDFSQLFSCVLLIIPLPYCRLLLKRNLPPRRLGQQVVVLEVLPRKLLLPLKLRKRPSLPLLLPQLRSQHKLNLPQVNQGGTSVKSFTFISLLPFPFDKVQEIFLNHKREPLLKWIWWHNHTLCKAVIFRTYIHHFIARMRLKSSSTPTV